MNHTTLFRVLAALLLFSATAVSAQISIIPRPNHTEIGAGEPYRLAQPAKLQFDRVSAKSRRQFTGYLRAAGFTPSKNGAAEAAIRLQLVKTLPGVTSPEGYTLTASARQIVLTATTEAGLFYGIQSLLQLIDEVRTIPAVTIKDSPRFSYRGLHLDVSRHFFPVEFIKKHLDIMARLKLNSFHWHLTDGPGWRLEIKKYPLLTQIAAWRPQETWKAWWATKPREYVDIKSGKTAYGGFYTQQQAREIVKYAADRHITVIPEIEMPGHSEEVLAVYPHLSCAGEPYKQSEFCIGNEQTFVFLENVLKEVFQIFPSEYIHIGGDEAEKHHWKKCPKCQARMLQEGLKDEEELQSYLIRRIEQFLIKNKRKLIGWDEILDGGLAPEATVMSWRGEEGGIKAAKSGHDAIMTPGGFMYLDSYQGDPNTQPEAIGGYLTLERVYSYNPVPDKLTAQEAKHILGVQSNLWTEYISTEAHADFMLYPRALAMAEVAWTDTARKDWNDFKCRVKEKLPCLRAKGINAYALATEPVFTHHSDTAHEGIRVEMFTERCSAEIRYTTDGTEPTAQSPLYTEPLIITDSTRITARLFEESTPIGKAAGERFDYHKAANKRVIYNIPANKNYYWAAGERTFVDGERGGFTHSDGRWQGFMTSGIDVTIDMGAPAELKSITAGFMQNVASWIYFPKEVVISVSDDNTNFTEIARLSSPCDAQTTSTLVHSFQWTGAASGRYIRYQAIPNGIKGGWVFLDEIVVW